MSYVDGVVLRGGRTIARLSPRTRRRTGELLVDDAGRAARDRPGRRRPGDFGRPDGYLERQVRRWHEQWERSKTRDLPSLEEVAAALR